MAGSSKKVIYAALIGNVQLSQWPSLSCLRITGSSAMFSEGIHSVVDTGNQILLFVWIKASEKTP